jgi:hypothetical protein
MTGTEMPNAHMLPIVILLSLHRRISSTRLFRGVYSPSDIANGQIHVFVIISVGS